MSSFSCRLVSFPLRVRRPCSLLLFPLQSRFPQAFSSASFFPRVRVLVASGIGSLPHSLQPALSLRFVRCFPSILSSQSRDLPSQAFFVTSWPEAEKQQSAHKASLGRLTPSTLLFFVLSCCWCWCSSSSFRFPRCVWSSFWCRSVLPLLAVPRRLFSFLFFSGVVCPGHPCFVLVCVCACCAAPACFSLAFFASVRSAPFPVFSSSAPSPLADPGSESAQALKGNKERDQEAVCPSPPPPSSPCCFYFFFSEKTSWSPRLCAVASPHRSPSILVQS
jgi:hypothetical protein